MAAMVTDALIILMLSGGIVFAYIVNKRVKRLMTLLHELEPAVQQFSLAVDKSEASVAQMQRKLSEDLTRPEKHVEGPEAEEPTFATRRVNDTRDLGVRVIRNKQDLVRRFFEMPREERQV